MSWHLYVGACERGNGGGSGSLNVCGEVLRAVPPAGSRCCRVELVPLGLGDAPQGQAVPLATMPCPSLPCHVSQCHAMSFAVMPCLSVPCHIPCCCAAQSTAPASTAIFTLQPENKAQMPEQPPHQLPYMQRALTNITTTCKDPGASANNGSRRGGGVSQGASGDIPKWPGPSPHGRAGEVLEQGNGGERLNPPHPTPCFCFYSLLIFNFLSLSFAAHSGSRERSQQRNVHPGRGPRGWGAGGWGPGTPEHQSP